MKVPDEKPIRTEESNKIVNDYAKNQISEDELVSTESCLDIDCHKQEGSVSNVNPSSCLHFVPY